MTNGAQPPHAVAALVHFFNAPSEVEPSQIAWQMSALDTLLHEQIVALSGSKSTPLPPAFAPESAKPGMIKLSGTSGTAKPFNIICNRSLYSLASPTNTAPSNLVLSASTTIFL